MRFGSALLVFAWLLILPAASPAQNLLSNPESIVYDADRQCYLVSNWDDDGPGRKGAIVRIDAHNRQTYFNTDLMGEFGIAGLYIYGDQLLAAAGNAPDAGIAVFDLETAEMTDFIVMPGVGLPNDITSDSTGVIYVTDYWGDQLYQIVDGTPSVIVSSGLYNPNGILYDRPNHRLLTLAPAAAGCPVMATSIPDFTVSFVTSSGLGGYDGIVADSEGRVYISEWTQDAIHRYDDPFSSPHTVFSTGHTDPADIYYDDVHNLICVPNFSTHSIDFVPIEPAAIDEDSAPLRGIRCYPQPCGSRATLRFRTAAGENVRLLVCDAQGRSVRDLVWMGLGPGSHERRVDLDGLATGIYHYRLARGRRSETGTMVVVK